MKFDKLGAASVVLLFALVGFLILGMLFLTPAPDRTDLIRSGLTPIGAFVSAFTAAYAAKLSYQARAETRAQAPALEAITKNTNGLMTSGFSDAISAALDKRGITVGGAFAPVAPVAPVLPVLPVAPVLPIDTIVPLQLAAILSRLESLAGLPASVPELVPAAPVTSLYGGQ